MALQPIEGQELQSDFWRYFHLSTERGEGSPSDFRGVSTSTRPAVSDFLEWGYCYKSVATQIVYSVGFV